MNQRPGGAVASPTIARTWPEYLAVLVEPLPGSDTSTSRSVSQRDDAGLHERVVWWEQQIAAPYLASFPSGRSSGALRTSTEIFDAQVTVELRIGYDLLADMLEAYASFGWDVVEAAFEDAGRTDDATIAFLTATRLVAASCVAAGLLGLERKVAVHARHRWSDARGAVAAQLEQFAAPANPDATAALRDRDQAGRLLDACRKLARQATAAGYASAKADRLGASNARSAAALSRVLRGKLATMHAHYKAAVAALPAAALIVDNLPASITVSDLRYEPPTASCDLEHAIYTRLTAFDRDLLALLASLDRTEPHPHIAALAGMTREGIVGSLGRPRAALPWGVSPEDILIDSVVGATEPTDLTVMGHLDLLSELAGNPSGAQLSAWQHLVLQRYVRRLAARIEADERWNDALRRWLGAIAAALGILATVALVLSTAGVGSAALPALAGALALIAQVGTIFSVALLIYSIIDTLQAAKAIDEQVRQQLFRLTEAGPDELRILGNAIARSRAVLSEVGAQVLLQLLMSVAASARSVAIGLEAYSFAGDVATITALFE